MRTNPPVEAMASVPTADHTGDQSQQALWTRLCTGAHGTAPLLNGEDWVEGT